MCYHYTISHRRFKQNPRNDFMGWVKGFEPSTPGTTIRCSNQLSYTHHIIEPQIIASILLWRKTGTPEGARTPDLLLRRQLLYPPELLAHIVAYCLPLHESSQARLLSTVSSRSSPNKTHFVGLPFGKQGKRFSEAPPAKLRFAGAGDGNRTHVSSLEGWCSTIELRPRMSSALE